MVLFLVVIVLMQIHIKQEIGLSLWMINNGINVAWFPHISKVEEKRSFYTQSGNIFFLIFFWIFICSNNSTTNFTFSLSGDYQSAFATQVWLMGDGTNDSYSNMIRNQVYATDQNYTKLNLISMVSNDIETVSINGLS